VQRERKNIGIKAARVFTIIICFMAIVNTINNGINNCIYRVEELKNSIERASESFNSEDFIKVISETQNIEFLEELNKAQ